MDEVTLNICSEKGLKPIEVKSIRYVGDTSINPANFEEFFLFQYGCEMNDSDRDLTILLAGSDRENYVLEVALNEDVPRTFPGERYIIYVNEKCFDRYISSQRFSKEHTLCVLGFDEARKTIKSGGLDTKYKDEPLL